MGVNLAGILEDAEVDPGGFVGGQEWGPPIAEGTWEAPTWENDFVLLEMAYLREF